MDSFFAPETDMIFGDGVGASLVDRRDHPCGDKHSDKLNVPDNLYVLWLKFWGDASDLTIYNLRVRFRSAKGCRDLKESSASLTTAPQTRTLIS